MSRHASDFDATIAKVVETPGVKYEVKFFYEGSDLNAKPKVTTMIPKVKG